MTTTNEWDEAARKAAEDLQATAKFHEDILTDKAVIEIIAEHFTELRETQKLLVELVNEYKRYHPHDGMSGPEHKCFTCERIDAVLNPLIRAAIEGREK